MGNSHFSNPTEVISYSNNECALLSYVTLYYLRQTMLEDKLRETDWELTQDTIEEQVARESYMQWLKDQEKYGKMSKTSVS